MKKHLLLLILLITAAALLPAQDLKELLVEGSWGDKMITHRWGEWISFREDGVFEVHDSTVFDYTFTGQYELSGERLYMRPDIKNMSYDEGIMDYRGTLEYIHDDLRSNSIWTVTADAEDGAIYGAYIESPNGLKFWNRKSFTPDDQFKTIDGISVRTSEKVIVPVYAETPVLTGPGEGYSTNTFNMGYDRDSLPEGRQVVIIGRAEEEGELPHNQEDYWYYVQVQIYFMEESGPDFGWIHGSCLDFDSMVKVEPLYW
ncbi:MAG: hypothetical protein PQJ50_14080 [Spirochaetales bacterium]|nr:hypothetical protein [Spirochaetales bacterium]